MKILVVDDSAVSRALLTNLLRKIGYEASAASNGQEALEHMEAAVPDLIVSDALMPKMDGFELCRRVRTDPQLRHIPFVFYSADYISPQDERFALELGANRYLVKTGEPGEFVRELEQVLQQSSQWRAQSEVEPEAAPEEHYLRGHRDRVVQKLEEKVDHLERANRQIIAGNRKLQDLDRMKRDFIASLSPRLRAPLAVVMGFLQLVLSGKGGPLTDQQVHFLEVAMQRVEELSNQIQSLLDFDLKEAAQRLIHPRRMRLADLLQDAMDTVRHPLEQHKLYLELVASDPDLEVQVDPESFQQIIVALLDNAIKFTPPGGSISLETSTESQWVVCQVRDTGIGIPTDVLPVLFDSGRSTCQPDASGHQGLGLGLAIARHLVELHGGRIWAESQPQRGSVFTVILPWTQGGASDTEEILFAPDA